jgi:uncharacterized protein (TIGR00290 family)
VPVKALISWSSGKDCAFALHHVRQRGAYEIVGALTTVTDTFGRVSIHGVRDEILRAQLDAAQLSPWIVPIPYPCPNEIYEERMGDAIARARREGVSHIIFGDLFLEDIRAYRIEKLKGTGISPVFPLWQTPTAQLARDMITSGLEAHVVTVDLARLPASFAGRRFDESLLADLPEGIDPCGENGEFHTCVIDGPMFSRPLRVVAGEQVIRDGFAYSDLLLDQND